MGVQATEESGKDAQAEIAARPGLQANGFVSHPKGREEEEISHSQLGRVAARLV